MTLILKIFKDSQFVIIYLIMAYMYQKNGKMNNISILIKIQMEIIEQKL